MPTDTSKRDELQAQMRQAQVGIMVASRRYEAVKGLYDAASFAGDGQQADTYRQQLHAALDDVLDKTASAMALTRKLMELPL